ncbi:MAG: DNA polymerase III subunit beta [Actinomycetota bacterium]|nr:DNA polymerase III subunit beta [Actinomycetota bacterium]
MKIQVERDVLADAVAWAARSLPTRPPVPVLAGLLLEATADGTLAFAGFDYEVSARVEVPADVAEPGRALVSGRLLADISRSLPARPVDLVLDGQKVVVSCGAARFTLLTLPVEEYPALPAMPAAAGSVAGAVFSAAVAQVTVAAGRDDTLPVLTGVRVEIDDTEITLYATDRYRLATRRLQWTPERPGTSAVVLVPARTLADAAKALGSAEVTLALSDGGSRSGSTGEGMVGFEGRGRRMTARLLDGEFPKVRALFPPSAETVASVELAPFVEAVKRVALVAERNTPVRLAFSDGQVTLQAGAGDEAQASESLEADLDGVDITIAFNPAYLLDGLAALGTPYVQMSFTTPAKPAVLAGRREADGEADGDYRYLLMPVRLSG